MFSGRKHRSLKFVEMCCNVMDIFCLSNAVTLTAMSLQAYATTMGEGRQLIKALEQQGQMMNIDNREAVAVIERLVSDIGSLLKSPKLLKAHLIFELILQHCQMMNYWCFRGKSLSFRAAPCKTG